MTCFCETALEGRGEKERGEGNQKKTKCDGMKEVIETYTPGILGYIGLSSLVNDFSRSSSACQSPATRSLRRDCWGL
jgi:hypothetical protein